VELAIRMCDGHPVCIERVVAIAKSIVHRGDCGRDEVCVDYVADLWMGVSEEMKMERLTDHRETRGKGMLAAMDLGCFLQHALLDAGYFQGRSLGATWCRLVV